MEKTKNKEGKITTFVMSENEFYSLSESSIGLCLSCGSERDCCEPDARNYLCEICNEKQVFGIDELMIMGKIEFTDEDCEVYD